MANSLRKHRSVYCITQADRVRPVYESKYNKLWTYSLLLNSKLTLKKKWVKPPPPDNEVVEAQADIIHGGFISDLAFSFDGRYLVAGSTCSDAYVLDPNTSRREIVIRKASSDAITRVCFAGDNKFVVGSASGSLMLWDVRNTKEAACSLVGHSKVIRSISYDRETDLLLTCSCDDHIRYWKISEFQSEVKNHANEGEEVDLPCGSLLTCPNISAACLSPACKKLAFITSSGSLFVVDNLDLELVKHDMHRFRFDNSILLQLSWFTPNSALNSRNRLRVIEKNDVIPNAPAEVSKINFMEFHETHPLLITRMTTSRKIMLAQEKKEWTCGYSLNERTNTAALYYSHECVSSFGSDVMEEKLTYLYEEERFNPLREKRLSSSGCGRLIASPGKKCIRLLSFSKDLHMPLEMKSKSRTSSSLWLCDSMFSPSTNNFDVFSTIEMPENASICTKFSPRDHLLVVGDINDNVHFFQPVL